MAYKLRDSETMISLPMMLSMTSRGLGVNLCNTLKKCCQVGKLCAYSPNLYSLYRVYIAVFEYRLFDVLQNSPVLPRFSKHSATPMYDANFERVCQAVRFLPEPVKMIIDAIGIIKDENKIYLPTIAADLYDAEDRFKPCAENVRYSNLRKVVESLSNTETPKEYRRNFYIHSCLPGAIWDSENYILLNTDDIMPANFTTSDLQRDLWQISHWLEILQRYFPKFVTNPVRTNPKGKRSAFVSNSMETLRLPDRKEAEDLVSYLARFSCEGSIKQGFYSPAKLTTAEIMEGKSILLGEGATYPNQNPIYDNRFEAVCPYEDREEYNSLSSFYSLLF